MQPVRVFRLARQRRLDLVERARIEQVAQLLLAEQLAEEVTVERERLRTPLCGRRVVLVHVRRDVVEEERGRIRRGRCALHVHDVDLPGLHAVEEPLQRGEVEDVLEHLPEGLEHDREGPVLLRYLEKALGLEPLLPERCPLTRPPPRDQQRTGGVLTKARPEERSAAELTHDQVVHLVRVEDQLLGRGRRVGVGEVERDPVVRPEDVGVDAQRLLQAGRSGERPRCVHPGAVRREDADSPVADLVAEALDDDRPVGGHRPGRLLLLPQEGHQVLRRKLVERVLGAEPLARLLVRERRQLAGGLADRFAQLVGPTRPLALPERDRARDPRRRRDEDAVARDLLDPPG